MQKKDHLLIVTLPPTDDLPRKGGKKRQERDLATDSISLVAKPKKEEKRVISPICNLLGSRALVDSAASEEKKGKRRGGNRCAAA